MRVYELTCVGCGRSFEAGSSQAKWHDPACRKRVQRAAAAVESATKRSPAPRVRDAESSAVDRHGLVVSVRAGLEEAGTLESIDGQLALQLARRLANPEESAVSSLSKELRTVLASALGTVRPPRPTKVADEVDDEAPGEVDDEVTRARTARAQARQAAGLT